MLVGKEIYKRRQNVHLQVVWRRTSEESPLTIGEDIFTPDKSISIFHEEIDEMETHWDLWINEVQPKHAGIYECSISATDNYTLNITLNVLGECMFLFFVTLTSPISHHVLHSLTSIYVVHKDLYFCIWP